MRILPRSCNCESCDCFEDCSLQLREDQREYQCWRSCGGCLREDCSLQERGGKDVMSICVETALFKSLQVF